ncbi:MAG: hypothetical protein RIQ52_1042 [Pseudomonadota bacterium]|jgi:CheY-like chemotaxis protein
MMADVSVLVADDNEINRDILAYQLKKLGYSVLAAENGQQVLDCLLAQRIDVILMDLRMPVMDGLEACRRIKAWVLDGTLSSPVPVIAMTGSLTEEVHAEAQAAGVSAVLSKPYNSERLGGMLAAVLNPTGSSHE